MNKICELYASNRPDETEKVEQLHLEKFEKLELEDKNDVNESFKLSSNNDEVNISKITSFSENINKLSGIDSSNYNVNSRNSSICESIEKIANMDMIRNILNLDDSELAKMVNLELWEYYKKIGTSIWPSYLRYENPPSHVKTMESRFYLRTDENLSEGVIYSEFKNKENGLDYIKYINNILKDIEDRKKFKSLIYHNFENTRIGSITYYLITNGLRKSTIYLRCQYCGSSNCSKNFSSCKSNRCFKCLLKGHKIKDCNNKTVCFNQEYLLPAKAERDFHIKKRNIDDLFNFKDKSDEVDNDGLATDLKYCICIDCNQMGHTNCLSKPPCLSEIKEEEGMLDIKNRFLLDSETNNSSSQHGRKKFSSPHNDESRLFNISYLLRYLSNNSEQMNKGMNSNKHSDRIIDNKVNSQKSNKESESDKNNVSNKSSTRRKKKNKNNENNRNFSDSKLGKYSKNDNITGFNSPHLIYLHNPPLPCNFTHSQVSLTSNSIPPPPPHQHSPHIPNYNHHYHNHFSPNHYTQQLPLYSPIHHNIKPHTSLSLPQHIHPIPYNHQHYIQVQQNNLIRNVMHRDGFHKNQKYLQSTNAMQIRNTNNEINSINLQNNINQSNRSNNCFSIYKNMTSLQTNSSSSSFSSTSSPKDSVDQASANSGVNKSNVKKKRRKFNNGNNKK
ncbi:hypothetical protein FG386_000912 [Cryptosporidium ryanae]|uniref:uncharacterized protein n=1 Tax=Cryptosporidium ryanae TaxID=515981 RepID=UPI003519EF0B|nr:hypothetical protein FG386_000912 [Cryptosporidium ryanae]